MPKNKTSELKFSEVFFLIYDESKSVLLVFDPDRKYKNITYIYQE